MVVNQMIADGGREGTFNEALKVPDPIAAVLDVPDLGLPARGPHRLLPTFLTRTSNFGGRAVRNNANTPTGAGRLFSTPPQKGIHGRSCSWRSRLAIYR